MAGIRRRRRRLDETEAMTTAYSAVSLERGARGAQRMNERRCLQIAIALASLVPISAGLAGAAFGASFTNWLDDTAYFGSALDSHVRYLSGLLLGIGIAFLTTVPEIETHARRFMLLTLIVFAGGLARLAGVIVSGPPHRGMLFALAMELVVTPLLWAWQKRLAQTDERSGIDVRKSAA
jgi:hypothetical protein